MKLVTKAKILVVTAGFINVLIAGYLALVVGDVEKIEGGLHLVMINNFLLLFLYLAVVRLNKDSSKTTKVSMTKQA